MDCAHLDIDALSDIEQVALALWVARVQNSVSCCGSVNEVLGGR